LVSTFARERFMSSRSCRALFETTFSALHLQTDAGGRISLPARTPDNDHKSNIDKSFWMLRELGRGLALAVANSPGDRRDPDMRAVMEALAAPMAFSLRRLHAERLIDAHLPVLRRLHGNAQVMETLGGVRTAAESVASLERNLAHWDRFGFGLWVLRDLATGRVAGTAGLRHEDIEGAAEVELRCALFPEFWGRGLGTDAARACVTIGRDWLGLPSVVGLVAPANPASQRVLVKAGLAFEREVMQRDVPRLLFRTD
jgi:[ribosomal protein S5]-alanine N-acetyltransferase